MLALNASLKNTSLDSEWSPKYIDVIAALYVCALVSTWVVGGKLFSFGPFPMSAGNLVYPMTCIFGDVLTEIYGFNRTRRLIWTGLACGFLFLTFTQIAVHLPPSPAWGLQSAFAAVNGQVARTVVGSYIAYVCCEFTNSFIMSKMKVWSNAKNFPLRAVASTVAAQLVDSVVFFSIVFIGVVPPTVVIETVITGWIFKSLYEFLAIPFTTIFVYWLKGVEGVEHFDRHKLKVFAF